MLVRRLGGSGSSYELFSRRKHDPVRATFLNTTYAGSIDADDVHVGAMLGFGPFAGFLTLSFATIGFLAKLLAEDIEDIDAGQTEAIRATGASWLQLVNYAVQPQVMPRLIGLSMYRIDINFRESAVVGIVGAGGIGATLNTALSRYEYDTAAAILIIIIVIVMIAEYSSSVIRKRIQ